MSEVLSTPTVGLGGLAQLRAADAKEEQRSLTFSYFNSFLLKYKDKDKYPHEPITNITQ